ncbi:MAG TPA: SMC family ATPase [Candidatus Sphingobacterium stercoripullorum]|uniref:SMC family ATPase n=1 Tax=Candidatus Sphingobacterium stercoripullorum TaxID=2838759 RepID=A0A9D1WBZ9_9SPHI|nr:SMC family ATPase [Candidatus Sphingobacterium stercoripullorum]
MIPIKLTIEGVYSYQKKQIINFQELSQAGLFGIFGSVGSGKSSILEAITFALYGDTERLSRNDSRNYNMMNLQSDSSLFDFEFLNHNNERYRIIREYKRNGKRFEDVAVRKAQTYAWDGSEWIPLDGVKTEDIIGLNYKNFKRTIIIPQGKFRDFIELSPTDRTNMLKEIFDLYRFDLGPKARGLAAETKTVLDNLTGELKGFEEINEQELKGVEKTLKEVNLQLQEDSKKHEKTNAELLFLTRVKEDMDALKAKTDVLAYLTSQKPQMEERAKALEIYMKALYQVQPFIRAYTEKNSELTSILKEKQQVDSRLVTLEEQQDKIEQQNIFHQKEVQRLPELDRKAELLKELKGKLLRDQELTKEENRHAKGGAVIKETEERINKIAVHIADLDSEIEALRNAQISTKDLLDLGAWYNKQEELLKELNKWSSDLQQKTTEGSAITGWFSTQALDPSSSEGVLKSQLDNQKEQIAKLEAGLNKLSLKEELSRFATTLQHGESCPLCGSLEHPDPMQAHSNAEEIGAINKQISSLKNTYEQILKTQGEAESKRKQLEQIEAQKSQITQEVSKVNQKITEHRSIFLWNDFDMDNKTLFEERHTKAIKTEQEKVKKEKARKEQQDALELERKNLRKYEEGVQEIAHRINQLKTANSIFTERLENQNYKLEDFPTTPSEVDGLENDLIASRNKITKEHESFQEIYKNWHNEYTRLGEKARIFESQIDKLKTSVEASLKELNIKVKEHGFQTIDEVNEILENKLNIRDTEEEIQTFQVLYQTRFQQVQTLKEKLKDQSFDQEQFDLLKTQEATIAQQLDRLKDTLGGLSSQHAFLIKKLEEKKKLEQEFKKTSNRYEEIKVLVQLFNRSGFVNYVSGVWLENIVSLANERFHRMTKNQLSLVLSEDNNLEVIDYLNEGKRRSVKTLSGGQSFQVSLALALALAESVQSLSKAEKSFFFIDEGFGTLDSDSVDVVFETLNQLNKENRIVGIISHVEALQERLAASLHIHKDPKEGSLIQVNRP